MNFKKIIKKILLYPPSKEPPKEITFNIWELQTGMSYNTRDLSGNTKISIPPSYHWELLELHKLNNDTVKIVGFSKTIGERGCLFKLTGCLLNYKELWLFTETHLYLVDRGLDAHPTISGEFEWLVYNSFIFASQEELKIMCDGKEQRLAKILTKKRVFPLDQLYENQLNQLHENIS